MNRRSFITNIIAAAVAPSCLVPVLQDRQRWKRVNDVIVPANTRWIVETFWYHWDEVENKWHRQRVAPVEVPPCSQMARDTFCITSSPEQLQNFEMRLFNQAEILKHGPMPNAVLFQRPT